MLPRIIKYAHCFSLSGYYYEAQSAKSGPVRSSRIKVKGRRSMPPPSGKSPGDLPDLRKLSGADAVCGGVPRAVLYGMIERSNSSWKTPDESQWVCLADRQQQEPVLDGP